MAIRDNLAYWEADSFGVELVDMTVGDLFDQRVRETPEKEALVYSYPELDLELRLNYREYGEIVTRLAKGLIALGIEKGDHVGVWATNVPEWVYLQIALAKIGAVIVTINTNYRQHEIDYVLRQGDIKALFLIEGFRNNHYLESIYQSVPELRALSEPLTEVLDCANLPALRRVVLIGEAAHPGVILFTQVLQLSRLIDDDQLEERQQSVRSDDVAMMQYTSGTTGFPKGVMLNHYSLVNQGQVSTARGDLGAQERYVTSMPFFHIAGSLGGIIYSIFLGSTLIPLIYFDPLKQLQLFEQERASFTFAVPTMLIAMLNHPKFAEFDLSLLKKMFTGATPVPVVLMEQIKEKMGADCSIVFGMTETTGAVTQSFHDDNFELKAATVGLAQPHTAIKIIDPVSGRIAALMEPGELCSKAFSNMIGYYNLPDRTAETIDSDGWLHSGDLAVMRPDGYLNIVGRVKDMVIRGGENVYPAEVEAFLMRHPAIAEAQVVGVPDALMGEETCALLRLTPGASVTAEEIIDWCKSEIARHKVPRYVRFVESYPLTPSGKVQKFLLRDQLIRELMLEDVAGQKTA